MGFGTWDLQGFLGLGLFIEPYKNIPGNENGPILVVILQQLHFITSQEEGRAKYLYPAFKTYDLAWDRLQNTQRAYPRLVLTARLVNFFENSANCWASVSLVVCKLQIWNIYVNVFLPLQIKLGHTTIDFSVIKVELFLSNRLRFGSSSCSIWTSYTSFKSSRWALEISCFK